MTETEYTTQLTQHVAELYQILDAAQAQAEALMDMVADELAALDTLAAEALPDMAIGRQ